MVGTALTPSLLPGPPCRSPSCQADARALFRQLDTRRSGRLRPPQVAQLTRRLLPSLMPRQLRLALAHLLALDADGDGQLSWGELVHGMRATRVRLPEGGALEGGFRARMVGSASHAGRRPGENQPKPLPHETFSFHPDSAELMLPPATKTAKVMSDLAYSLLRAFFLERVFAWSH